ncbi:MAG: hypothetical protein ABFD91_02200 [Anaerohalosphaeraceae bacterium]
MNTQALPVKMNRLAVWLFNPFTYLAGWQALMLGVILIIGTALLGSVGNVHFDGVLDMHMGAEAPLWFFIAEGFIDWLSLAIYLWIAGLIVRGSAFRMVDVFGTQALARWPMLLSAAAGILPANQRVTEELMKIVQNPGQPPVLALEPIDVIVFAMAMIIILVTIIWMIVLMYRAYAVSCNLKGAKAFVSFIICLLVAEAMSKLGLYTIIKLFPLN